jgi:hypothetical protein
MLTRRQFLRHSAFAALLGIAHSQMTAMSFAALAHGTTFGVPPESELLGRLFKATDVRAAPHASAEVVKQLPADHIQPICAVSDDGWWYRIAEGYLPREAMQPIPPYVRPPKPTALHAGYYEVIAPSATLRAACTPYAAIYGAYPFGTVVYVRDWLTDDHGQVWYALTSTADGSGALSWTSALNLRRWLPQPSLLRQPTVWLDCAQQTLSLYDGERFLGKTAIHAPLLPQDQAMLQLGAPSAHTADLLPPRPWSMLLHRQRGAPVRLYGCNLHNRFGMPSQHSAVELPVLAAKQLYQLLCGAAVSEIPVLIA